MEFWVTPGTIQFEAVSRRTFGYRWRVSGLLDLEDRPTRDMARVQFAGLGIDPVSHGGRNCGDDSHFGLASLYERAISLFALVFSFSCADGWICNQLSYSNSDPRRRSHERNFVGFRSQRTRRCDGRADRE